MSGFILHRTQELEFVQWVLDLIREVLFPPEPVPVRVKTGTKGRK